MLLSKLGIEWIKNVKNVCACYTFFITYFTFDYKNIWWHYRLLLWSFIQNNSSETKHLYNKLTNYHTLTRERAEREREREREREKRQIMLTKCLLML